MNTNSIGGIVSIVMLTGVPIASIAIAGNQLFIRTNAKLYCIGNKK